jgi:hypothetical protein
MSVGGPRLSPCTGRVVRLKIDWNGDEFDPFKRDWPKR